jgi:hypothetical protein
MEEKFIPLEKLHILQDSFGWLNDYQPRKNENHRITNNKFEKDEENTKLLLELGKINIKRNKLINELYSNSIKIKKI